MLPSLSLTCTYTHTHTHICTQANRSSDPILMYKHMLSQEVGTQHAVLYSAYASALEEAGNREEAMRILELGISRKAHPQKRLHKKLE